MRTARAVLLGALHGPAELVPVSSSAHVALVPWLLGWQRELDPARRKELEVLLHAGTGIALGWVLRREALGALRRLDARRVVLHLLALGIPSAVGLALEEQIEERLGTPGAAAAGLAAGALLLLAADALPEGPRTAVGAGPVDGLVLGLAQAAALAPGVSRRGATLAAARMRGYSRGEARVAVVGGRAAGARGGHRAEGAPGAREPARARGARGARRRRRRLGRVDAARRAAAARGGARAAGGRSRRSGWGWRRSPWPARAAPRVEDRSR